MEQKLESLLGFLEVLQFLDKHFSCIDAPSAECLRHECRLSSNRPSDDRVFDPSPAISQILETRLPWRWELRDGVWCRGPFFLKEVYTWALVGKFLVFVGRATFLRVAEAAGQECLVRC